jgi:hypothetical protein
LSDSGHGKGEERGSDQTIGGPLSDERAKTWRSFPPFATRRGVRGEDSSPPISPHPLSPSPFGRGGTMGRGRAGARLPPPCALRVTADGRGVHTVSRWTHYAG